jgi:hypothetical protein
VHEKGIVQQRGELSQLNVHEDLVGGFWQWTVSNLQLHFLHISLPRVASKDIQRRSLSRKMRAGHKATQ